MIAKFVTVISGVFRMCERRGPEGLGDGSPLVGSRGKAPVGGLGDKVPQKLTLFVTECLTFNVLEEKN